MSRQFFVAVVIVTLLFSPGLVAAQEAQPGKVLIQSVRVFDGQRIIENADVLFQDGLIKAVGQRLAVPDDAEVIDGTGKTLLPGLIDCHVHAYFDAHLVQTVQFGVTTVLDMMSVPWGAANLRAAQKKGEASHRADYFSAGSAVTVEGGHGTQFGFKVPVLKHAEEAEAFVNDRIREGSDYIKIIHEPGTAFGLSRPTLTPEMLKAAIEATLAREKLAVAHIGGMEGATLAVDYGISGLVHLFADHKISEELVQKMLEKNVFVIPTTAVIQNITGPVTVNKIVDDPHIGPLLNTMDLQGLGRSFPSREGATNTTEALHFNIAALEKAGVPILAGTDAPNPGTTHGASMHHELELLTLAGLTNEQALAAATSRAADCFQLDDRGRIESGRRADLLLVNGNPTEDIRATRDIDRVWKGGYLIDRQKRYNQVQQARERALEKQRKDKEK